MCGILFATSPSIRHEQFEAALDLMSFRGPDSTGIRKLSECWLGHKRLKIRDLDDRSNQPFISKDGRYALIYNGEIYNTSELISSYNLRLDTTSDTEVLFNLLIEFGDKAISSIEGMFAFVFVDTLSNNVLIARDRLGVKPLYICQSKSHIIISSEIAPIRHLEGPAERDSVAERQYLKLRTFFNGRTIYSDISQFPPGCYMLNSKIYSYWKVPEEPIDPPSDEQLRCLIIDSILSRRVGDVPYGAYLSGGLDSSIIATVSSAQYTWSAGFSSENEFDFATLCANEIGSLHTNKVVSPDEYMKTLKYMVGLRKEPLSVPNEVLLYSLSKEAKSKNTIILSGEGADELFCGYDRIFRWAANSSSWDTAKFAELYSYGSHVDYEIVEDVIEPYLYLKNPLSILTHFFLRSHLLGLLRRLDSASMLASVEARVPFVDCHKLIELVAMTPYSYKSMNNVVKAPLKRIFSSILPPVVVQRKKVGFPVPLPQIFLNSDPSLTPMDAFLRYNLTLID